MPLGSPEGASIDPLPQPAVDRTAPEADAGGSAGVSIAAVERDTGLSKDTLRVWERRYGFPQPARDSGGERLYPVEQVDRLRLLKRLMDQGHRPGKIVGLPLARLQRLAEEAGGPVTSDGQYREEVDAFLDLVKRHRVEELRRQLSNSLLKLGLARFTTEIVARLNARIGEAWSRGTLEIFEEHLYTESIQVVLRNGINTIPRPGVSPPVVLLTTFPQEPHGLGLLMAEAIFALEGCRCISLGVQTPIWDIVLAASAQPTDIVALSFTGCINPKQLLDGLEELRARLPARTEIWAGGSCAVLDRRGVAGVRRVAGLREIELALNDWRRMRRAVASRPA